MRPESAASYRGSGGGPLAEILRDPFFWAFVSMAGVGAGDAIVSNVVPRSRLLGLLVDKREPRYVGVGASRC